MTKNSPDFWAQATRELSKNDPVLKKMIKTYKGEMLKTRGNAFETLARSIVGQQISVKAAESVWRKTAAFLKDVTPAVVAGADPQGLRACGLSERKVLYMKDLAEHFLSGKIKPHGWKSQTDEEIIEALIEVKGIGPWTAEMFLIFHLLRPNVFPADDLGLQKAIALHYGVRYPMTAKNLLAFRKRYSPWASVATWYLWRSLDPIPVEY
jgi:DNA-3-methyladenine glycosylase II